MSVGTGSEIYGRIGDNDHRETRHETSQENIKQWRLDDGACVSDRTVKPSGVLDDRVCSARAERDTETAGIIPEWNLRSLMDYRREAERGRTAGTKKQQKKKKRKRHAIIELRETVTERKNRAGTQAREMQQKKHAIYNNKG